MYVQLDTYEFRSSFGKAQRYYDNQMPDETELDDQEKLSLLTFSKKWELAKDNLDASDKDLRKAIITDLFNCYELSEIIDFIRQGKTVETEKYLNDVLVDCKLI